MNDAERLRLIELLQNLIAAKTTEEMDRAVDLVLAFLSGVTERRFGE